MIRTNRNSAIPVYRGDLVRVFPKDKRDKGGHSMEGIPGIVFNNPKAPGWAINAVTKFGVIGRGRDYSYLSREVYTKSNATTGLGNLRETRDSVLRCEFVARDHPIISMRFVSRQADLGPPEPAEPELSQQQQANQANQGHQEPQQPQPPQPQ
jgi:hypothetical protein